MRLLRDADLADLPPVVLFPAIRSLLAADHEGQAVAPPRQVVDLDPGAIVFTTGGDAATVGFRAYETLPVEDGPGDQVVAAWDRASARMLGVALGARLGQLRTGAIGGVALAALLGRQEPVSVGLVGCGPHAETQLLAAAGAVAISEAHVFCRTANRREAFARRLGAATGLDVRPAASAEAAVRSRDVVILATSARAPVVEADWIAPHAHVTTVGPKLCAGHELPLGLADRAATITSDSPRQIAAAGESHMLAGREAAGRIEHLGAFIAGAARPRGPTLFPSAGPAGSEIACLRAVIEAERGRGVDL